MGGQLNNHVVGLHQSVNQCEAGFVVRAIDGVWKITDLELLQEERRWADDQLPDAKSRS